MLRFLFFPFFLVQRGRWSWLSVSFSAHVKHYTIV